MTAVRAYKPRHLPSGGPLKRHVKPKGSRGAIVLPDTHAAIVERRSLFPHTVRHPSLSPRLLVSGVNSRKIGKMVVKGRWSGMPIYTRSPLRNGRIARPRARNGRPVTATP